MMMSKELVIDNTTFVISKMPIRVGDRWANSVALALLKSGVDISGLDLSNGFTGFLELSRVANIALKALGGVEDEVAQKLLDELMEHVKVKLPDGALRTLYIDSDISDIKTLWKLRIEAIKINTDFLTEGVFQK